MQNHTDFGTSHFSTPQTNMDVSSKRHRNKFPKCTKYGIKKYNFLYISGFCPVF